MFTLFCFVFVVSLYPVIYLTSVCVMYVSIADLYVPLYVLIIIITIYSTHSIRGTHHVSPTNTAYIQYTVDTLDKIQ